MSWFQENKFLGGFLVVTAVGAGALGFLAMSAQSKFAASDERYNGLASELGRLQSQSPFPSDPNVKKMDELRQTHEAAIVALQADLSKAEIPVEPISPVGFQDLLKASVDEVRSKAAGNGVELAPAFYLGYAKYETAPPKDAAAAPLARMLKAIKLATLQLIQDRVATITSIEPELLPEEKDPAAPDASGKKEKKADAGVKLVDRHPFTIVFVAKERAFHNFVNQIVTNKQQFMIPKSVAIDNEKLTGPPREVALAVVPIYTDPPPDAPPPAPTADGTPAPTVPPLGTPAIPAAPADPNAPPIPSAPGGAAAPAKARETVVGEEKLSVTIVIEVADFTEPSPPGGKATSKRGQAE